jgi:hypothetical protein
VALGGQITGVESTLLQKRDGSFYLALWLAKQSWDPFTGKYDRPVPQSVTVTFGETVPMVRVFVPNDGTGYGDLAVEDNAVSVPVSDKVMIVRIAPEVR